MAYKSFHERKEWPDKWPPRREGETNRHYVRRTGICFHRWTKISKLALDANANVIQRDGFNERSNRTEETPSKIVILARCRWCSKLRSEIITIDMNSSSVYAKRTLFAIESTLADKPTNAPQTDGSSTVAVVADGATDAKHA